MNEPENTRSPWFWVPTLYIAESLPYVIVTELAGLMYKNLGMSNTEITIITSWFYLAWVIKCFWSPFVDNIKTKRWWIFITQSILGFALLGIGLLCVDFVSLPFTVFIVCTVVFFIVMAMASATHDIAADGYYMLALDSHKQSLFVGIRSTFYRIGNILGTGVLTYIAGEISEVKGFSIKTGWGISFLIASALMIGIFIYHHTTLAKTKEEDRSRIDIGTASKFFRTFAKFFQKKNIGIALAFILLFRLGEAQLGSITKLFMTDPIAKGGLGLTTAKIGLIRGTAGVIALLAGGVLGGFLTSKDGLKKWFWPMVFSMNLPNLVYIYLAAEQPGSLVTITSLVCIEQFGYGFGFSAFMLYLLYYSKGENKTANYSICSSFMALGMMIPSAWSGWLQTSIGYTNFFIWVCICTIPGFIICKYLRFDPNFGKKEAFKE